MKQLISWLSHAMLSPLAQASAVHAPCTPAQPARRLDHPTYLRRGLCISGLTAPVARAD